MSRANCLLPLAFVSLALLVGCGNNNNGPAPNNQGFSNSNLSGTYVFSSQGFDAGGNTLNIAGAFSADGSGSITGGAMDIVEQTIGLATNQPISSGPYFVDSDGRGQITLNVNGGPFVLDFVLTAGPGGANSVSTHGLVTEFDGIGSGSGTLDLQTAPAGLSQLAGNYAFSFAGSDGGNNAFASAGAFALNASGATSAGVQDFNDSGSVFLGQSLSGSALFASSPSPIGMTLASSFGTLNFDFYPIDTTHFKAIETDNLEFLAGDVFSQPSSTIPSGAMAFSMSGGITAPVSDAGIMTSDGTGNFTGGEDANIGGTLSSPSFTGTAASGGSVGGRVIVNLTGFSPATQWVIYPSGGGLIMLESDTLSTTIGAAYVQTAGAALSTTQGYGFNLSAWNNQGGGGSYLENDIAEFAFLNNEYTGGIDISDDFGPGSGISLSPNQSFSVSFTGPDSSGRGSATTSAGGSGYVNFNFYMVDDSTALVLETDSFQIGSGIFGLQTSSQASVMARGAFSTARPLSRARFSKKATSAQAHTR
jgi:hypothetical protein